MFAYSAMSKSPDGTPVGPKMPFAASGFATTLIPIDFSSAATIASVVVRTELLDVQLQLNTAGRPAHVHTALVFGSTELGPPEQCLAMSASAAFGLKFHFAKS